MRSNEQLKMRPRAADQAKSQNGHNTSVLATVLAILFIAGCSSKSADYKPLTSETIPPATITPGNEASTMPLDKGNQWTFDVETVRALSGVKTQPTQFQVTWTVTESQQTPNGTKATIVSSQGGKNEHSTVWLVNSKGIYQLEDGTPLIKYDPPLPVLLFPAKPHTAFDYKGAGPTGFGDSGPHQSHDTILESQVVDTSMGQMSAIPVESEGTVTAKGRVGKSVQTVYFAPGIGIVRMRQEAVAGDQGYIVLMKLKSKSLMKA